MGPWPWSSPLSGWGEGCTFRPGKGQGRRTPQRIPCEARSGQQTSGQPGPAGQWKLLTHLWLWVCRGCCCMQGGPCPRGPGWALSLSALGQGRWESAAVRPEGPRGGGGAGPVHRSRGLHAQPVHPEPTHRLVPTILNWGHFTHGCCCKPGTARALGGHRAGSREGEAGEG